MQEIINFFIYDTIKLLVLLFTTVFLVTLIRTYLPINKVKNILAGKNIFIGHILASLFGIITPFCSCSAVPLFIGFLEAGIPLGVTFSFLIASPMINEVALGLLFASFGWKVALIYVAFGLVIAIISGLVIGKFKIESLVDKDFQTCGCQKNKVDLTLLSFKQKINFSFRYSLKIVKKVWLYIVLAIAIGAVIHGAVPDNFLAQYLGKDNIFAIPLAVLFGIPLYANAAGMIPIVSALVEKGVSLGTALAFMMSVTALSFPEFILLKRVMKIKLIAIFAGVVGLGIMLVGYLLNALV